MTSFRFQFLIGLLLITVLLVFSAIFFRYTAQIAQQMPPESVQILQQAVVNTERNRQGHGTSVVKKLINFIKNVQHNTARKLKKDPSPVFTPLPNKEQEKGLPPALQDSEQSKRVTDPLKK